MISACLLGICCRYDGRDSGCPDLIKMTSRFNYIPFCPEQLGGLSTPRPPARIVGGDGKDVLSAKARVLNSMDEDVTDAFIRGAEESLRIASMTETKIAFLKDKSPSCGIFIPGKNSGPESILGVTATLFNNHGIRILELNRETVFSTREFNMALNGICGTI